MKERPILFSGPMVLALLAGSKTQTRRVMKPRKDRDLGCELAACELAGEVNGGDCRNALYAPGARLWVREAHAFSVVDPEGRDWLDDPENWDVIYRADEKQPAGGWRDSDGNVIPAPWRPSIHMPRWASRITLDVTEVRVERLQDISEADAKAEGASFHDGMGVGHSGWRHDHGDVHANARSAFARLWTDINGPGSWAENPWVWCVSFRRAA